MWKGQAENPKRAPLMVLVGEYLEKGGRITYCPPGARALGIDTLWGFLVRELEHNAVAA